MLAKAMEKIKMYHIDTTHQQITVQNIVHLSNATTFYLKNHSKSTLC